MALLRDVVYRAGPKLTDFIKSEVKILNLRIVKKLTIKFDPFADTVKNVRAFSHILHTKEASQTTTKVVIKTEILSDRSEPTLTFDLTDGKIFLFKCGNLNCLEILQLINKHITPLSPIEEPVSTVTTKSLKGKGKK